VDRRKFCGSKRLRVIGNLSLQATQLPPMEFWPAEDSLQPRGVNESALSLFAAN